MFYFNIELSVTQNDRVLTHVGGVRMHVGGVRIEFDIFELSDILGISSEWLNLYTSKNELHFSEFNHLKGVRNICK